MPSQPQRPGLSLAVRSGPGSLNSETLQAALTMQERSQGQERANLPSPFREDREGLTAALTEAAMQDRGLANAFPSDALDERRQGKAWAKLLLRLADNYDAHPEPVARFRDILIAESACAHLGTLIPVLQDVAEAVQEELEDLQQTDV